MNKIDEYLTWMTKQEASDLYLVAGKPPVAKVHGKHVFFGETLLTPDVVLQLAI